MLKTKKWFLIKLQSVFHYNPKLFLNLFKLAIRNNIDYTAVIFFFQREKTEKHKFKGKKPLKRDTDEPVFLIY